MISGVSSVRYSGQLSTDGRAIRAPGHTIPSNDTLPLCWSTVNADGAGIPWNIEDMGAIFNPNEEHLTNAHRSNGSPRLPDHMFDEAMNQLGTVEDFSSSPSSQILLMPIEDAPGTLYPCPGGPLSLSLAEDNFGAFSLKRHEESPFFQLEKHLQNLSITSTGRSEQSYLMFEPRHNNISLPNELADRHRRQSKTSVFQEVASIASNAQMITAILGQERLIQDHRLKKLADSLGSLLPDNMPELSYYTGAFDEPSFTASRLLESPFHRTILYSVVNNFAGLPRLPEFSLLQAHLSCFGLIKSCPSLAVRSFIDNVFSTAVWSRNARAVDFLLKMTYGTPYPVDVNKTIVTKDEIPSTPIIVALRLESHTWEDTQTGRLQASIDSGLETAEVLLKAGVDATRALEAFRPWFGIRLCPSSAMLKFIQQLLDRGVEPDKEDFKFVVRFGDEALFDLLLARIPHASYRMYFDIQSGELPMIARLALDIRNSKATQIIKNVLYDWPRSTIEKHFPGTYESTMKHILVCACAKGNKELVEFLLPFISQVPSVALAAAIRCCQQPLIELLLKSGTIVSDVPKHSVSLLGPATYMPWRRDAVSKRLGRELKSPLAEAILSRNPSLIQKLECTLTRAHSESIEQALEAAADVGDLDVFPKLLHGTSSMHGICVRRTLCLAIDRKHDDMAFMLLDAGIDMKVYSNIKPADRYGHPPPLFLPLLSAIQARQQKLIEAILEHEPYMSDSCYIRAAVLWGDVDTVKGLLASQATVSFRALRTALRSGDENMLNILLDHFWRHDYGFQDWNCAFDQQDDHREGVEDLQRIVKSAACLRKDTLLVSFLEHGLAVGRRDIEVAMRGKDAAILERLLAHAMRPKVTLDMFVRLKDHNLLRQYLSNGSSSFREGAFLYAMRFDKEAYRILMEAFSARYPEGLKGWGGSLLKNAIRKRNSSRLKELLDARMDVHSFGPFDIPRDDWIRSTPLGFAIYSKKGKSLDDVQMLLDAGSEPNGIASNAYLGIPGWKTPLILAVETGDLELIEVVLRGGADVNLAARNGRARTPLQRACELCNLPVVKLLLSRQADVNGEPAIRAGGTALQLTAIGGSIEIANLLLQNGANVRAHPAKVHGRTPFEGAAEHGRLDMLKVIWNATLPEGISKGEAGRAIHFSRTNGHGACEQYITYLVPMADISRPSADQRGGQWDHPPHWGPPRSNVCTGSLGDESEHSTENEKVSSHAEISSGEDDSDWNDLSL